MLALNLDDFSLMSNRLGKDGGEQVLAEVARRLIATLRPHDSVASAVDTATRLGGDQFLLLCEDITDAEAAESVALRVDEALRVPMTMDGAVLTITAGVGITLTADPHHDPEALIFEAETAMHAAKREGAGRHQLFAPEMGAQLQSRMDNADALRQALARGEFRVVYQPKVSLLTDRITGVEALLRWHDPIRGVIPPLDFIPLAEASGLIVPIGRWVLEQVCRDAKRWSNVLAGGLPLTVAVNVSPRQFEPGLAEIFGAIMADGGIDPASLCVEVTESMVMRDAELAIGTLRKLKSLGMRISIDDFGTGFSSLAYLKRFPLDELKIDKSFVDGIGIDPRLDRDRRRGDGHGARARPARRRRGGRDGRSAQPAADAGLRRGPGVLLRPSQHTGRHRRPAGRRARRRARVAGGRPCHRLGCRRPAGPRGR